ncbi:4-coumarate--CoA ligase 3 [Hyalella azteca]|uniref:4-coumarate--CoA ligase 3 n=1 Tax=Hyalella azteca TaxID=294128 RepID=A0A8B7P075_HYAAZ|nr:4-coumarate--CoA ligase 3 [Hyalella azteca]
MNRIFSATPRPLLRRWLCSNRRSVCSFSALRSGAAGDPEHLVLRSHYPDTPLPEAGVSQFLLSSCGRHTNRPALIDGITGRVLTYGRLIDGIQRWGAVVQERWSPGSPPPTVGIFMRNCPDYPIIFFGTTLVGGVVTPLNPSYTAEEVAVQLADSGASLLVVEAALEAVALKSIGLLSARGMPPPALFLLGDSKSGNSDLRAMLEDSTAPFAKHVDVDPSSVALLAYSSGTTGQPKGVCVTHSAATACCEMLCSPHFHWPIDPDVAARLLGLIPFYHIYGIVSIMLKGLKISSTVVTLPRFQPSSFIRALQEHKLTVMNLAPPLLKFLNESNDVKREFLQSCHTVGCGGAPLSTSSKEKFTNKFGDGTDLYEGFGMTECIITHGTPRIDRKLGRCGKLLPRVQAKIVDMDTGAALPPNGNGELCLKTPCMMKGYHNRPDATRETIDEDGWLHTGDVAVHDEDGFFSIVDRIKELIKVKGFQVSPSEIENVLLKHPAIADAGVTGIPHEDYGEVPRAYIISSKGSSVTENEINNYMKEHLAPYKQLLGGIKFVTDLPKNPSGKLLRKVLAKTAEQEESLVVENIVPPTQL